MKNCVICGVSITWRSKTAVTCGGDCARINTQSKQNARRRRYWLWVVRYCKVCNKPFHGKGSKLTCGPACQEINGHRLQVKHTRNNYVQRQCVVCGVDITGGRRLKTCSEECFRKWILARDRIRPRKTPQRSRPAVEQRIYRATHLEQVRERERTYRVKNLEKMREQGRARALPVRTLNASKARARRRAYAAAARVLQDMGIDASPKTSAAWRALKALGIPVPSATEEQL